MLTFTLALFMAITAKPQISTGKNMSKTQVTRITEGMEYNPWLSYFLTPILHGIALTGKKTRHRTELRTRIKKVVDKYLPDASEVARMAKTSRALDIIYDYKRKPLPKLEIVSLESWRKFIAAVVNRSLYELRNCQAARNRLKIVKWLMIEESRRIPLEEIWKVLVVACGSARASLEAVAERKNIGGLSKVILIDLSQEALQEAMSFAESLRIQDMVTPICGSVVDTTRLIGNFRPDTIEMVGLTDYLPRLFVVNFFKMFKDLMAENGKLIMANVVKNTERPFVKEVFGWPMIYRSLAVLLEISLASGYPEQGLKFFSEPLGIFYLLVLSK
ncbi:MAG: class I SAM-dependent methyltransferase [Candidatus Uhrbacteria bacterium]